MAPPARLKAISPLCPRPGRGRRLFSGLKHPIDKRTETIQQTQKMTGQTSGNVQDNRGGPGVFETWAEHGPEQVCRVRCVLRLPRKARVSHTRPPFTPSSYPHKFIECSARSPVHMSHVRTFIGACLRLLGSSVFWYPRAVAPSTSLNMRASILLRGCRKQSANVRKSSGMIGDVVFQMHSPNMCGKCSEHMGEVCSEHDRRCVRCGPDPRMPGKYPGKETC